MSAITGLYNSDGRPVTQRDLALVTEALRHRGPDGSDSWIDGEVGLGHGLLSTRSNAGRDGAPPLVQVQGPFAITADSRLDNREELLAALGWSQSPGSEIPDARLILGAYQRWGEHCPTHLLGDFAFILWDGRNRRLFCARDPLGLKPLYYLRSESSFALASEIKALVALRPVSRHIHAPRVVDYLMQMPEDSESTFYRDILRLPPAHSLTITRGGGVRRNRYWTLDADREIRYSSDAQYGEAYREIFHDAVRCRMRDASPVGSLLSGGLDSSSVTCVARSILEANGAGRLKTFSCVFDDLPECDERPFIEAVVESGGLDPHYVDGARIHPLHELDRMLWHLDEPFFTPNLFLYWELYRRARAVGVRVLLDGLMGDNVVSHGARYLTELAAKGRWIRLAREMRVTARALGGSRRKRYRYLARDFVLRPLVVGRLQRARTAVMNPVLPASPHSRFVNEDLAREIRWMNRARRFGQDVPRTPVSVREEHSLELRSGAFSGVFEILDKAAAAFSLTPRLPFTDRRLVEYCLAVPATQKYRDGWTRVYARHGLHDDLPQKIRTRYGKTYLGESLRRGLLDLDQEETRRFVMERLPVAREYVNVSAVQSAFGELTRDSGRVEHRPAVVQSIWSAVILTRWLELERQRDTISGA